MKKYHSNFKSFLFVLLALGISVHALAQTLPNGYVHQKVLSTELPTGLAFTPDGRPIVLTSVGGTGRALIINTDNSVDTLLVMTKVFTNAEKGLLGIAFDPNYASNGYIYVYATLDLSSGGTQNTNSQNSIVRFTAKNYKADLSTRKVLLGLHISPKFLLGQPNHDGGTIAFGSDGKLYVASGDLDIWCSVKCMPQGPNASGCNCGASWVAPTHTQDTSLFLGKILRINPDGTAPTDNPFYKAGSTDARNYIFALGVRNPYTMHFKKGTNQLWINDVGSSGGNKREEINMLDITNPSIKRNLGYNNGTSNPGDGTPPSTEGSFDVNAHPAFKTFTAPVYSYAPSEGCAIAGGVFYEPTSASFESKYVGKYFYMDFCQGWIKYMDADGKNIQNFATGLAGNNKKPDGSFNGGFGSVAIESGPDGYMYHLVRSTDNGVSGLYRIKGPLAVGVDKEIANNRYAFSVHPNPSLEGKINVHYNAAIEEQAVIEVFNQVGILKKSFNINGASGFNDYNLDMQDLERGVYVVKFSTANAKASQKLVIK
jgi:glucose/arabinose dehydrogenase